MTLQLLVLALISTAALGQAQAARLAAIDGPLGDGIPPVIERLHGADATISAVLLGMPGTSVKLSADVYLSDGVLAAPMLRGLHFQQAAASTHPALIEGTFTLPHPDTVKPVTQVVAVQAAGPDGTQAKAGAFLVRWTSPAECQAALACAVNPASTGKPRRLLLFGVVPGLREQLRAWQTPFEDLGKDALHYLPPHAIVIGDDLPAGAAIPLSPASSSLFLVRVLDDTEPGVMRKESPGTRITVITLRRAQDWRQSAFLIRHLTEHLSPLTP